MRRRPPLARIDFETRKPIPILTGKYQQHITADIAYAIRPLPGGNGDKQFLEEYGAEVVLLGARFWASRVEYSAAEDCYDIKAIMGPRRVQGNSGQQRLHQLLVQKHLLFAGKVLSELTSSAIIERWGFSQAEGEKWAELAAKNRLPRRGDLLEQFDGFLKLKEIDVLKYRDTPGALQKAYSWRQITGVPGSQAG
jgi:trehalose/maltose hydrolase-like predicted phosphorylase